MRVVIAALAGRLAAISTTAAPKAAAGGIGAVAGLVLLLPMEAGVPVPIPADVVMLAVGARASAGDVPLWVAVLAFEAVAVIGTTALFLLARGPGHALIERLGPKVGITAGRLGRASGLVERRGRPVLALGRATPGLRTVTVIAAGGSGLSLGQALPALIAGSSIFLQLHLFLGYYLGPAAGHVLHAATGPALVVIAVLLAAGIAFWLVRRRRRRGAGGRGALEGLCPACLALAYLAERPAAAETPVPVPANGAD
jgi:membrane-associated protein